MYCSMRQKRQTSSSVFQTTQCIALSLIPNLIKSLSRVHLNLPSPLTHSPALTLNTKSWIQLPFLLLSCPIFILTTASIRCHFSPYLIPITLFDGQRGPFLSASPEENLLGSNPRSYFLWLIFMLIAVSLYTLMSSWSDQDPNVGHGLRSSYQQSIPEKEK